MTSASILIENSDNKLTQQEWSAFVEELGQIIARFASQVHFFGGTATFAPRQNVCWVVDLPESSLSPLREALTAVRKSRNQQSVALLLGKTEFV